MVTVLKSEGGTELLSSNLQKIIQSLKELTGINSDTEVYNALRESNMDANEAAQKLLNQGPFHEVRRKRDKKKENTGYKDFSEHRKLTENANHSAKFYKDFSVHRKLTENSNQNAKFYAADRNFNSFQRDGYTRNNVPAVRPVSKSREFRVVRDNRVNQNSDKETKLTADAAPPLDNHSPVANVSEKSALGGSSNNKHSAQLHTPRTVNRMTDSQTKFARDVNSNGNRKEHTEEKKSAVPSSVSHVQTAKQSHSQPQSTSSASGNSVGGVYASASDPVHVPLPDLRSPAMKREVGVVGGRRQSLERISKQSSQQSSSNSNSVQGTTSTLESFQPINNVPRKDPPNNASLSEPAMLNTSRAFLSQHHGSRQHQPPVGHQRGALPGKEWKPKPSQKAKVLRPGVIGTPLKSASPPCDNSEIQETDAAELHGKLLQVNIQQPENVIIAQHIRVPENDRCRLTFGSFGMDVASSGESASGLQVTRVGELAGTSGSEETSDSKQLNSPDDQVRNSSSNSPSNWATEQQIPDKEATLTAPNAEQYSDMGLVRESSPPFPAPESQQRQEPSELPNFAGYDLQTGYDIPYFRQVDDTAQGQNLPSPQEDLTSHSANSVPASSIAMLQQQPPLAQMYPQVHVSHFANIMPYRQFLSPVYVPPMGLHGYSGNPTYGHPSNGSSYVLMPGGSSHLAPNNLKYGVQQFKPVPAGSASGFGNYGSPTGYAINPPGVIGGATGVLEDSARLKYKDSNLYVPNPQAETSEVWIPNPRELPGIQSAPYYSMQGQAGHPAYLQSHAGHASFNPAAVAQSSHMQFPGVYHPPQPAAIPSPHMAAPVGGSVGVGVGPAAPGPQVGAYQQPQLGHLNWTTNF